MNKTIVISGATGQQGGATARALAGKGFTLRALTRDPNSDKAKALAAATGAELVKAELDDEASIKSALQGAWGAYAVQNTWTAGVDGEEAQGHALAELRRQLRQRVAQGGVGRSGRRVCADLAGDLVQLVHESVPRLAPAALVAAGVEDDAVEPGEKGLLGRDAGSVHFDEYLLHGVVDLLAEPLEEEDTARLGGVPAEELSASLRLVPAQPVDQALRQLLDGLPPL